MARASDIQLSEQVSILMKGPFGFGKTLAAASYALRGPTYLSYWDKKGPVELVSFFSRFGKKGRKILDNIEYDVYGSENANDYLNKLIDMAREGSRYEVLINDSLTFMTASAVHWSQNFGKDPKLKKKIKDVLPDWDEYKVETNLISQCIDISRKINATVIWTAHPMPTTKIEGSGSSMRVTKVNPLVSYGQKVAGMVPGSFTEIYHFGQKVEWSANGSSTKRYIANLDAVGDEFAKSPLLGDFFKELDVTDRLFYEVWKEAIEQVKIKQQERLDSEQDSEEGKSNFNPFDKPQKPKWG